MTSKLLPSSGVIASLVLLMLGCAESPRSYPARETPITTPPMNKETKVLATPWENEFGLVQGARAGGIVLLSGQYSLDEKGAVVGKGSMETQMRQAYANVLKALQLFNLSMNDVLEETLYVTDMSLALVSGPKVRREVYSDHPAVATSLVQVQRLPFSDAMVEIRVVAKAALVSSLPSQPQSEDRSRRHGGHGGMGRGGGAPY